MVEPIRILFGALATLPDFILERETSRARFHAGVKPVLSNATNLNLGAHVFPSQKYRLITKCCLHENKLRPQDFTAPGKPRATRTFAVHTAD